VLLPGVPLPLHIFEPDIRNDRGMPGQKKPLAWCGVSDGVADIGCTAEIMSLQKYDDGA